MIISKRSSPPDVFCRKPATLLKNRLWHKCFPVNFVKFLRTPFSQNIPGDCFYIKEDDLGVKILHLNKRGNVAFAKNI